MVAAILDLIIIMVYIEIVLIKIEGHILILEAIIYKDLIVVRLNPNMISSTTRIVPTGLKLEFWMRILCMKNTYLNIFQSKSNLQKKFKKINSKLTKLKLFNKLFKNGKKFKKPRNNPLKKLLKN